jgi:hypothetical protein
VYEAVVAPVPPETFEYGPPEVLETIHWVVKPEAMLKPVAVIAVVKPEQMLVAPVKEATGAFGAPEHGGGGV